MMEGRGRPASMISCRGEEGGGGGFIVMDCNGCLRAPAPAHLQVCLVVVGHAN